jgi:hypothetical protein
MQRVCAGGQGGHATGLGFQMAAAEAQAVSTAAREVAQPAEAAQPGQATLSITTGVSAHEDFSMDDAFLTELDRIFQTDVSILTRALTRLGNCRHDKSAHCPCTLNTSSSALQKNVGGHTQAGRGSSVTREGALVSTSWWLKVQERLRATVAPQFPDAAHGATAESPTRHGEEAEGLQDMHAPASLDNQLSQQPGHHCSAAGDKVPATTFPFPAAGTGEHDLFYLGSCPSIWIQLAPICF